MNIHGADGSYSPYAKRRITRRATRLLRKPTKASRIGTHSCMYFIHCTYIRFYEPDSLSPIPQSSLSRSRTWCSLRVNRVFQCNYFNECLTLYTLTPCRVESDDGVKALAKLANDYVNFCKECCFYASVRDSPHHSNAVADSILGKRRSY